MSKDSNKRFTMRITEEQKKELRIVAAMNNMNLTEFVDMAIRNEIHRFKEKHRDKK